MEVHVLVNVHAVIALRMHIAHPIILFYEEMHKVQRDVPKPEIVYSQ